LGKDAALRIAAASCALAGRDEEAKRLTARLLELTPPCGFPKLSKMFWARIGIQNTRQSMQMLCERRACLNDGLLPRGDGNNPQEADERQCHQDLE